MKISSEQEMLSFGEQLAKSIIQAGKAIAATCSKEHKDLARAARSVSEGHAAAIALPTIIELIGDVGAGKTTFVRGLAKGLGVKNEVTSPSFTISKSYALPNGQNLIHYDFYRLPDPGLMADDLQENINSNNIVVVEWADSIADILPKNHTKIYINYNNDNTREVIIE